MTEGMGKRPHYKVGIGGIKCACCQYNSKKRSRRSERRTRKNVNR
jgi:hypothetical protein|tara:strand:+ start:4052 stop:4186 length:135 start_codon:yes stop_codon:yes gene_type:complete